MTPCLWKVCGGWMKEIIDKNVCIVKVCAKCGRSPNIEHEKYIEKQNLKPHRDLHTCSSGFEQRIRKILREKGEEL